ncbi:hypothetical protein [Parerythrobacter jejuensis]|nr:hypothetical protein [Parerythrobacter jejuensis]
MLLNRANWIFALLALFLAAQSASLSASEFKIVFDDKYGTRPKENRVDRPTVVRTYRRNGRMIDKKVPKKANGEFRILTIESSNIKKMGFEADRINIEIIVGAEFRKMVQLNYGVAKIGGCTQSHREALSAISIAKTNTSNDLLITAMMEADRMLIMLKTNRCKTTKGGVTTKRLNGIKNEIQKELCSRRVLVCSAPRGIVGGAV